MKTWRVISDWKWVLLYAWSVKFSMLAAFFGGLEALFAFYMDTPPFGLPKGTFALMSAINTGAAIFSRFIAQREGS